MLGDSVEVCNEYANSILEKRGKEYDKQTKHTMVQQPKHQLLKIEDYPEITYTNESILNEDVKIVSSFISDSGGNRVSVCNAGEKYVLSVIFDSKRSIDECIVGFVVETVKGLWIINCNTLISGRKSPFFVEENSLNKVDFEFIMPPLVNGDYVIGIAISEGSILDFKVITWLYNVLYMQVTNIGANDGIFYLDSDVEVYSRKEGKNE